MNRIPYNIELKELSKALRKNATLSEVLLWKMLRAKQIKGYTFNRQKPLLNYIVDFYCKPLNLVIEIDGESHNHKFIKDNIRQKQLEDVGLQFLRFTDLEVKKDMNNVIRTIEHWIDNYETKQ